MFYAPNFKKNITDLITKLKKDSIVHKKNCHKIVHYNFMRLSLSQNLIIICLNLLS